MPSLVEIGKEVQSEEKKLYKVVNVLLLTVYLHVPLYRFGKGPPLKQTKDAFCQI